MLQKILVPTDGSELSLHAMKGAVELATRLQSRIVGLTVVEPYAYASLSEYRPETIAEYEQRADQVARERLAALRSLADAAGVAVETTVPDRSRLLKQSSKRHGAAIAMRSSWPRTAGAVSAPYCWAVKRKRC